MLNDSNVILPFTLAAIKGVPVKW